jgi:hypothetical protein
MKKILCFLLCLSFFACSKHRTSVDHVQEKSSEPVVVTAPSTVLDEQREQDEKEQVLLSEEEDTKTEIFEFLEDNTTYDYDFTHPINSLTRRTPAEALSMPTFDSKNYCANVESSKLGMYYKNENIIAVNSKGSAGGGVCWWVTRLMHRAANFVILNPNGAKYTPNQVKIFLSQLKNYETLKRPLHLNGYTSLDHFYKENTNLVDTFLSDWKNKSSLEVFTNNITFNQNASAGKLWNEASKAAKIITEKNIPAYIILKYPDKGGLKGIFTAHSVLAFNVIEDPSLGCLNFEVRDSNNRAGISVLRYCKNATDAQLYGIGREQPFTLTELNKYLPTVSKKTDVSLYVQREKEMELVQKIAKSLCP